MEPEMDCGARVGVCLQRLEMGEAQSRLHEGCAPGGQRPAAHRADTSVEGKLGAAGLCAVSRLDAERGTSGAAGRLTARAARPPRAGDMPEPRRSRYFQK